MSPVTREKREKRVCPVCCCPSRTLALGQGSRKCSSKVSSDFFNWCVTAKEPERWDDSHWKMCSVWLQPDTKFMHPHHELVIRGEGFKTSFFIRFEPKSYPAFAAWQNAKISAQNPCYYTVELEVLSKWMHLVCSKWHITTFKFKIYSIIVLLSWLDISCIWSVKSWFHW